MRTEKCKHSMCFWQCTCCLLTGILVTCKIQMENVALPTALLTLEKKLWHSPHHLFWPLLLSFLSWFTNLSQMTYLVVISFYAPPSQDWTGSAITLMSRFTLSSKRPNSASQVGVLTNQEGSSFSPPEDVNNEEDGWLDSENIKIARVSIPFSFKKIYVYIWNPYSETFKIYLHP